MLANCHGIVKNYRCLLNTLSFTPDECTNRNPNTRSRTHIFHGQVNYNVYIFMDHYSTNVMRTHTQITFNWSATSACSLITTDLLKYNQYHCTRNTLIILILSMLQLTNNNNLTETHSIHPFIAAHSKYCGMNRQ